MHMQLPAAYTATLLSWQRVQSRRMEGCLPSLSPPWQGHDPRVFSWISAGMLTAYGAQRFQAQRIFVTSNGSALPCWL